MMPKWSQNPSKIDEKSIAKSRSEKGRPKIEKNRGPGRPRVENVTTTVLRLAFLARGPPPEGLKDRGLDSRDPTRQWAVGPANFVMGVYHEALLQFLG